MKAIEKQSKPAKTVKPKRAKHGLVMPIPLDTETKHIEDEAEPLGANFA